jgi:NADH-quinone oxidoreductase subunit M
MGLPGFSGFVAELMIVLGAWHAFPALAVCVGFGILLGVIYVWRAMQKAFFADSRAALAPLDHPLPPITFPEKLGALILIATSVFIGIYPQVLLHLIIPALNSPLFDGLHKGSWQ